MRNIATFTTGSKVAQKFTHSHRNHCGNIFNYMCWLQSCTRGGLARKPVVRPAGRGPKKNLRAARAAHNPTTMTTDLSCFSLLRVRESLIKWKFVITHLHQFTETQFHERIPNLTLQVTIKNRNFWAENIYAGFLRAGTGRGLSCVKLRAAVTNFGPRATLVGYL